VGTDIGHVRDFAPDAAVAVPPGDAQALARAIGDVLRDDDRRLSLARRAQAIAVREDADWTCARVEELYDEMTGHGHAPAPA
jgi:glycosyltransferase involved in cell wall biosynthesis